MDMKRFVIMGAGEVGRYLARSLSGSGHAVTLVDSDPAKQRMIEERLDVSFVLGNGTHVPVLEAAGIASCDLFVASSSSDEANLAASLLAKTLGAPHTVVRVATAEDVTRYGRIYEKTFRADLLLSTQLLATTRIRNHVLGHHTVDIEYLAGGALQVRRIAVEPGSPLAERRLADADLPKDCLVLAFISEGRVLVPTGGDQPREGDDVLVVGMPKAIDEVERRASRHARQPGLVVVAGGGATAHAVVSTLEGRVQQLKLIELDRTRAESLAASFPQYDVIHGDATDLSVLASEGVGDAHAFIALTGHDEANLMACLLAQELGARQLTARVQKSETSNLWKKLALLDVVSPRTIAAERIRAYIDSNYEAHIVSFENGAAAFMQRRIHPASPAAGERLADIEVPRGLLVAAVLRGSRAVIPRGDYRLEVDDDVVLFVQRDEVDVVQLVFPGAEQG